MPVDDRSRLQLAEAAPRVLGIDEGISLMELLPPVGWADVATTRDLLALEARMDARVEILESRLGGIDTRVATLDTRIGTLESRVDDLAREIRGQTWRLMTMMIAVVGVVVAAVRL